MKTALLLGAALAALAAPARAGDLASGDQLRGFIDLRTGVADGERSWVDGGFGKTRFSGADDDLAVRPLAHGMLIWRPHLTWSLDGHVTLQADTQAKPAVDVVEAYLSYRGAPSAGWRWSGRVGLFYPPVSLEHDGPGWTTTNTITPSAINSWIGEEVKVVGVEATARHVLGEQELAGTIGVFGYNDTSGTLLAWRGWALDDVLPGVRNNLRLPATNYQQHTDPSTELDDRLGYYARVEYRPVGPITFDVMHYENEGDRLSDAHGQTDWRTHFTDIGMRAALGPDTRLLAQVMSGRTSWGQWTPSGYWSDIGFASGYVLLAHDFDTQTVSGRVDYFETTDKSDADPDDEGETGWAITAAYLRPITSSLRLGIEGMHISSDRPTRAEAGLAPRQEQNTVQSSLKLSF